METLINVEETWDYLDMLAKNSQEKGNIGCNCESSIKNYHKDQGRISPLRKADDSKVQLTYRSKKVEDLISTKFESVRPMEHVEDACSIYDLK